MPQAATTAAAGSVAVAIAVLALKLVAAWLTGSVALFADALESVVNVAAAVAALAAIRFAALPADANHPYGHTKAEYFSAVLEGALIIVAALAILHAAWGAYVAPRPPEDAVDLHPRPDLAALPGLHAPPGQFRRQGFVRDAALLGPDPLDDLGDPHGMVVAPRHPGRGRGRGRHGVAGALARCSSALMVA